MLKNYIKIAWRNIQQNKLYSCLNIFGLALGLTVCMLILLYVAHEYSFDRFHKNHDRIFSVYSKGVFNGETINSLHMDYAFAPTVAKNDERIQSYLRVQESFGTTPVISNAETTNKFAEKKVWFADPNFFNFFSFHLLAGNPNTLLSGPFSVVLSEKMARKYFGSQNPVGKTLQFKLENSYPLKVTGVMKNMPSNTDFDADFILSITSMKGMPEHELLWDGANFKTFFLLNHASSSPLVQRGITQFFKQNGSDGLAILSPLAAEHFTFNNTATAKYLTVFTIVALLILFLALVNYMSLATARATLRAKEIGVRKITGASRKTIATQFYIESALYAFLSFAFACLLYTLVQSYFFGFLQINISDDFLLSPLNMAILAALLLVTIFIAGSYPSIVLSAFKPATVLNRKINTLGSGTWVRRGFTILQFTIAVALMICGITIYQQLDYIRHTDTGVNREHVVMIPITKNFGSHYPAFKKEVQQMNGIEGAATARYSMYHAYDMFGSKNERTQETIFFKMLTVDQHFIPLMGIQWTTPPAADLSTFQTNKLIINETLRDKLGLSPNALGAKVAEQGDENIEVAGVVKDFNFQSLSNPIDGLGIFIGQDTLSFWTKFGCTLFAKVDANTNLPTLIKRLKSTYEIFDTENPFEYHFVDEAFEAMFKAEERLATIFGLFISLTITIAVMGLLGLATFSAQQRTKEIGIRKVLGSTVNSLVVLLSRDFIYLVSIAILIASPIAWLSMNKWLDGFAYRTEINWWVFLAVGVFALLITLITISFQTVRSASANPVDSLRNE